MLAFTKTFIVTGSNRSDVETVSTMCLERAGSGRFQLVEERPDRSALRASGYWQAPLRNYKRRNRFWLLGPVYLVIREEGERVLVAVSTRPWGALFVSLASACGVYLMPWAQSGLPPLVLNVMLSGVLVFVVLGLGSWIEAMLAFARLKQEILSSGATVLVSKIDLRAL